MRIEVMIQKMILKYDTEHKELGESAAATSLNKKVIEDLTEAYAEGVHDAETGIFKPDDKQLRMNGVIKTMEECNIVSNKETCLHWFNLYFDQRFQMYQLGYQNYLNRRNSNLFKHRSKLTL